MFNTFLLPKLELALRYVHGRGTSEWVKKCDALVMGCIKHAAQSPLMMPRERRRRRLHDGRAARAVRLLLLLLRVAHPHALTAARLHEPRGHEGRDDARRDAARRTREAHATGVLRGRERRRDQRAARTRRDGVHAAARDCGRKQQGTTAQHSTSRARRC